MNLLNKIPTAKLAPIAAKISAKKPEILLGGGIALVVGGAVMACKTTWCKLPGRINEKDEVLADCEESGNATSREKTMVYAAMTGKIAIDYAPSLAMLGGGIAMIIGGHNLLRTRLAALGAAYATLEQAHESYRQRVIEEHGAETDKKYRLGIFDEVTEETVITKSGKEKVKKRVTETVHADGTEYSMYARYFDQFNSNEHVLDQQANYDFLLRMQNQMNEKLQREGYLFLNTVYKELGFKEVPEGQLVGWTLDGGDGYVDFGLFEARNAAARDSVNYNGKETCFILDFNVDGIMWNRI